MMAARRIAAAVRPLRQLAATRIARGTAVGFYALAIQLGVQLLSVPILTKAWGLAGYGIWVLLFTVPQFLAMADLGLTTVGANAMIEAMARGDDRRAERVYSALRAFTLASGAVIAGCAALVTFTLRPAGLEFTGHLPPGEGARAAAWLCLYATLMLFNGVSLAAFRAADRFASSTFVHTNIGLMENLAALAVALRGGSLAQVALTFLLGRLAGTLILSGLLHYTSPWVRRCPWRADPTELRLMVRPALAALLYPVGNAVSLQGAVMVIGAVGGPSAVPAFTVVRTLTRTALQFVYRFVIASMPRYTAYVARGDDGRAAQLIVLNLVAAAVQILPAAALMLTLGQPFIDLWTEGRITPGFLLIALMVAAMAANAAWSPLSNLLLSVNRHEGFVVFYVAVSIASVTWGAVLAGRWQAEGMAAALLLLDLAMIGWVWREARRHGLTGGGRLRGATLALIHELRPYGHSGKKPS